MAYTSWTVGDKVRICVEVVDFCGSWNQFLFLGSKDMQKDPTLCNISCLRPSCTHFCIDTRGREVVFKAVKQYTTKSRDVICGNVVADKVYRELGRVYSDGSGIATLIHTVTEQDRLDYLDAAGSYDIVACLSTGVGDPGDTGHAAVFKSVTINQNLCYEVTCPDICIGNDLYSRICNPMNGQCVTETLKEANSVICTATHYIEYDIGFLPQSFLDLIGPNIVAISNEIGRYISPIVSTNIIYKQATYENKKFRVYIKYSSALSLDTSVRYYYNEKTGKIETLALINTLPVLAGFLAGVIIFLKLNVILRFVPYGLVASAVVAVVGAVIIGFTIRDIITAVTTPGTPPPITPAERTRIRGEYADDVRARCKELWPMCAAIPPTCSREDAIAYNGCLAGNELAQYAADSNERGEFKESEYNTFKNGILDTHSCLVDNTCTVQQAINSINERETIIKEYHTETERIIECPGGIYDKEQKKCVSVCRFPILGYCMDAPLTFGAILLGGYAIYKVASGYRAKKVIE